MIGNFDDWLRLVHQAITSSNNSQAIIHLTDLSPSKELSAYVFSLSLQEGLAQIRSLLIDVNWKEFLQAHWSAATTLVRENDVVKTFDEKAASTQYVFDELS